MQWIILIIIGFLILFFWLILIVIGSISNIIQGRKNKNEFEIKRNFRYSDRVIDTTKDLYDRNIDIIEKHLKDVSISSSRYKYYYIDNMTRDCINDICLAEGKDDIKPSNTYLSNWKTRAPHDWQQLSSYIEKLFSDRKIQLETDQKIEEGRKQKEKTAMIVSKHLGLIRQFNEIAYRKVATIDNYGDENWDELDKEAENLVKKIAKKEGYSEKDVKSWKDWEYSWSIPKEYTELRISLISSFTSYYNARKKEPTTEQDFTKMSGIEFENYLSILLKENGFTDVFGTPKTGDQGADLIAKKNNRTIIIQAKRYGGSVGNKAVQEVVGAIKYYHGDEGWVITNSTFTKSARELANINNVKLIDGVDLARFNTINL